jgi:hypothetical protein
MFKALSIADGALVNEELAVIIRNMTCGWRPH